MPAAVTSAVILFALLATSGARAQLQLSLVSGRVLGADGAPVGKAQVSLSDPLGQAISTVASDDTGRFRLPGVAPGVYLLGAETPALRSAAQRVTVLGGLPVEVELRLSPPRQRERCGGSGHGRRRRQLRHHARG